MNLFCLVCLFFTFLDIQALIYQSSSINQYGLVNFTMMVGATQKECTSLLARGDVELIKTYLNFNPNNIAYSSSSDMFILVQQLDQNNSIVQCFQYGGYDYEESGCGKAGIWPSEWGTTLGTYIYTINVTKTKFAGEKWTICVGNGWTSASGEVSYSGYLDFSPTLLTYDIPPSPSPTFIPTRSPTQTSIPTSPTFSPTLIPSSSPTTTFSPTSTPILLSNTCNEQLQVEFNTKLKGGQSICIDFGADGAFNSFSLILNFSGSVDGEKASDFGIILYSTHYHQGVQYGGYNYYFDNIKFIESWPESWNSRLDGTYTIDEIVSINPTFDINGDYYRFCIFNGWTLAQEVKYVGNIQLGDSMTLNCNVIPPDLTPTQTPTPQPTLTLAPTSLISRGIYSISNDPTEPIIFNFDVNLTSSSTICSPITLATGQLLNISTQLQFTSNNDFSWASDMLVTIKVKNNCLNVGGAELESPPICESPILVYEWPKSFQTNKDGEYISVIQLNQENNSFTSNDYEVCLTNWFQYDDKTTVNYRGELSLIGLFVPDSPTMVPTSSPTYNKKKTNSNDDDSNSLSLTSILLLSILIPVGVIILLLISFFVVKSLRLKKSTAEETLINSNNA